MALVKTLQSGVPETLTGMVGTGAVTGQIFGIPPGGSRGISGRTLSVQITFSADPGTYVMNLMGSLDGTNFILLNTSDISKTTSACLAQIPVNVIQIRLDQVSKANSVTANAVLMVA